MPTATVQAVQNEQPAKTLKANSPNPFAHKAMTAAELISFIRSGRQNLPEDIEQYTESAYQDAQNATRKKNEAAPDWESILTKLATQQLMAEWLTHPTEILTETARNFCQALKVCPRPNTAINACLSAVGAGFKSQPLKHKFYVEMLDNMAQAQPEHAHYVLNELSQHADEIAFPTGSTLSKQVLIDRIIEEDKKNKQLANADRKKAILKVYADHFANDNSHIELDEVQTTTKESGITDLEFSLVDMMSFFRAHETTTTELATKDSPGRYAFILMGKLAAQILKKDTLSATEIVLIYNTGQRLAKILENNNLHPLARASAAAGILQIGQQTSPKKNTLLYSQFLKHRFKIPSLQDELRTTCLDTGTAITTDETLAQKQLEKRETAAEASLIIAVQMAALKTKPDILAGEAKIINYALPTLSKKQSLEDIRNQKLTHKAIARIATDIIR